MSSDDQNHISDFCVCMYVCSNRRLCDIKWPSSLLPPLQFLSHCSQTCLKMPPVLTSNPLPPLWVEARRVLIKGWAKQLPLFCSCTIDTYAHTHTNDMKYECVRLVQFRHKMFCEFRKTLFIYYVQNLPLKRITLITTGILQHFPFLKLAYMCFCIALAESIDKTLSVR